MTVPPNGRGPTSNDYFIGLITRVLNRCEAQATRLASEVLALGPSEAGWLVVGAVQTGTLPKRLPFWHSAGNSTPNFVFRQLCIQRQREQ